MSERGNPSTLRPRAATVRPNGFLPSSPFVTRVLLPGFGAHHSTDSRLVPTRTMADDRQQDPALLLAPSRVADDTGISGTRLPGSRAQTYRGWGHTPTGNSGMVPALVTGIPGTKGSDNRQCCLRFQTGNLVLFNRSITTTTRGVRIRGRGGESHGGPWPTKN